MSSTPSPDSVTPPKIGLDKMLSPSTIHQTTTNIISSSTNSLVHGQELAQEIGKQRQRDDPTTRTNSVGAYNELSAVGDGVTGSSSDDFSALLYKNCIDPQQYGHPDRLPSIYDLPSRLRLLQRASEQQQQQQLLLLQLLQNNSSSSSSQNTDEALTVHQALMQQKLPFSAASRYGGQRGTISVGSSVEARTEELDMDQQQQQQLSKHLHMAQGASLNSKSQNRDDDATVTQQLALLLQKQHDEQRLIALFQQQQQQQQQQNRLQAAVAASSPQSSSQQGRPTLEEMLLSRFAPGRSSSSSTLSTSAASVAGDISTLRFLQLQSHVEQLQRQRQVYSNPAQEDVCLSQGTNNGDLQRSTNSSSHLFGKNSNTIPFPQTSPSTLKFPENDSKSSSLSSSLQGGRESNVATNVSAEGAGVGVGLGYSILRSRNPFFTSYQDHIRAGSQLRREYLERQQQKNKSPKRPLSAVDATESTLKKASEQVEDDDSRMNDDNDGSANMVKPEEGPSSKHMSKVKPNDPLASMSDRPSTPKSQDSNAGLESDDDVGVVDGNENNCETFPYKLYMMLQDAKVEDNEHIVSFLSHGCAFAVHNSALFVNQILPKYFKSCRMSSFQRQLNLYGFRRITDGPDRGGYWHDYFIQDCPSLCKDITRKKTTSLASSSAIAYSQSTPSGLGSTSSSIQETQPPQQPAIANSLFTNIPTVDNGLAGILLSSQSSTEPTPAAHPTSTSSILDQINQSSNRLGTSSLIELVRQQQQQQQQQNQQGRGGQQNRELLQLLALNAAREQQQSQALSQIGQYQLQEQHSSSGSSGNNMLHNTNNLSHLTPGRARVLSIQSLLNSSVQQQQSNYNHNNNYPSQRFNSPSSNDSISNTMLEMLLLQQFQRHQQQNKDQ